MTADPPSNKGAVASTKTPWWRRLPNELRQTIIANAVSDADAWTAKQTLNRLRLTSRDMRDQAESEALQKYRTRLDVGRIISDAVVEVAFPADRGFSFHGIHPSRRHIGHETAALKSALRFRSPAKRSEIFNDISAKSVSPRMEGYSQIVERAELFQTHETEQIYRDALDTFLDEACVSEFTRYTAASIVVKAYHHLGANARNKVLAAVSRSEAQRWLFGESIAHCNESLLEDDELKKIVREGLDEFEDPHGAIAALASYMDKNSREDTDFIIKRSLRLFDEISIHGEEHRCRYPALAIARVWGEHIGPEQAGEIKRLIEADAEEGRALASALDEIKCDQRNDNSAKFGMRETAKLVLTFVRSQNMPNEIAALDSVREVSKSTEEQWEAARRALMNSHRERADRAR
jgi:hypothetical protein